MDTRTAYEAAERRLLDRYGVAATWRFLELREPHLRVRVLEAGTGTPALFIHGGGGEALNWVPLIAQLRGIRAIAVDRPGCGLSDRFLYRGVDLRSHAVSFVSSVLDALSLDRVSVVGNSMGGLWGLWAALAVPDRIDRLALLGCPGLLLDTGAPFFMRLMTTPLGERLMLGEPSAEGMRRTLSSLGEDQADVPDEFVQVGVAAARMGNLESFLSLIRICLSPFGRRLYFSENEARQVNQPTLFVWGDRDPFGKPSTGERATRVMARARMEVLRAGHMPWLDEPEKCADLVADHVGAPTPAGMTPSGARSVATG